MRLKLASGTLSKTEDFMEMAQLALQAGYPAEAMTIVEQGYAAGALGTGAEAERHKRLRDLAREAGSREQRRDRRPAPPRRPRAKDGNALVQVGYVYVTMGEADKGIALIEQGIAKGGLKRPEDAKLRLGMAQLQSAKAKAHAMQTLRSVQGTDGAPTSRGCGCCWALAERVHGWHAAAPSPRRWATASGASTPASTGRTSTPPTCWSTSGRAAFFDTGTNLAVPRLLATLDALGLARDAVDWVIPTHVHLDHAGGAGLLMRELPAARMLVHPRGAASPGRPVARCSRPRSAVYGAEASGARLRHAGAGARPSASRPPKTA